MVTKKGRKATGGRYIQRRKKRSYEMPGKKRIVKVGEQKRKTVRVRGGNKKTFLLRGKIINVNNNGKVKKAEIKNVIETPSNRFLARQNVLTKGTIVETEIGKVRITNRPTQEGMINGEVI